jgi:DNA-directed RNA polymerase specialized sigma24 family protein
LDAGSISREFLALLTDVVRTQLRRLPDPGVRTLTDDDVDDAVQDFCVERWEGTIATILAEATSDESMKKLLHTIVRHWRIDKIRATDRGSVRRRLNDHLSESTEFEQVPADQPGAGQWRLVGSAGEPWGGRLEDLVAAAQIVRVAAVRWTDLSRRPPIASAGDLKAVLRAVLEAADGQSLEIQQLVDVIMRRFPAALDPQSHSLDMEFDRPGPQLSPEDAWQTGPDATDRATIVVRIVDQLTPDEQAILPLIGDIAAVRRHLNCGRSTAYNRVGKLKDLLLELAGGHDDAEQIVLEVIDRCADGNRGAVGDNDLPDALDNLADASSDPGVATPNTAGGRS